MKKVSITVGCAAGILLLANWGAREKSEVRGDRLHRINFYGSIITAANRDKETKINNISIGNLIKQIPVYVAPTTRIKNKIDPTKYIIKAPPKDILQQVRLDLYETKYIRTKRVGGNPVIWKHVKKEPRKKEYKTKREYIEIIATSKDKTKSNYLIEKRKLLKYNEISPAGPRESKINFKGLIKLTIDGYKDREFETNNNKKASS